MKSKCKILLSLLIVIMIIYGCGKSIKNGLVKEKDGMTYYYVNDEKQTGWQRINDDWYYFYKESDYVNGEKTIKYGSMMKGIFIKDGGDLYSLGEDGKMLKDAWVGDADSGQRFYMRSDGKAAKDTELEINGKIYMFDSEGLGKEKPEYNLIIDCTFPKTFICDSGEIIIEKIDFDWNSKLQEFTTKWTGTCGYSTLYYGINESVKRRVAWKLYDPDGYIVDSGFFTTKDMVYGDKFRDQIEPMGYHKCKVKGDYRLEVMNYY